MIYGDTKRTELAEMVYDRLDLIAGRLLIRAEVKGLTELEFSTLSDISKLMGSMSKYCDVNLDTLNNKLERLKNEPVKSVNTFNNSDQPLYGGVQAYNQSLLNHQHPPTTANSGSGAPPVNPT